MSFANTKVFPYTINGQKLYADPLVVYQRLMEHVGGDLTILLERAYPPALPMKPPLPMKPSEGASAVESEKDDDEPPMARVVRTQARVAIGEAMRFALELPMFDRTKEENVTAGECESLYHEWVEWMDDKKKGTAGSPTPSTASPATGSPAPWATRTPSASG